MVASYAGREEVSRLEEEEKKAAITVNVVGVGGCGNNTISNLAKGRGKGAKLIAVNSDVAVLRKTECDTRVLIGGEKSRGAHGVPEVGKKMMEEYLDYALGAIDKDCDIIIGTCGLGGGTGTGGLPTLLREAKMKFKNAIRLAVVSLPMQEEGEERHRNAQIGLREIVDSSDMYVINANDVLVENSRGITLPYAFRIMDKRLARVVNSICRMQSTTVAPGVINVDFSNFQRLAAGGGLGFIGVGEGGKVHSSMEDALTDDFAACDLTGAREAIIYFEGKEFLLDSDEVRKATRHVSEHYRIPTVFMGIRPTWDLRDTRTTIIVSGVSSGYVDKFLKGGE